MDDYGITPIELLDLIKTKVRVELEDYPSIKSLLYDNLFSKIPVIFNKIPKESYLYRTVPINRADLTMGREKYLSYRPIIYNYPFFNRCSEPEQRHFYCSTDRHLSIGECSYFISESETPGIKFKISTEKLEVGMWLVTQDLYVADLRFGSYKDGIAESNKANIIKQYKELAKEKYIMEFFEHINRSFEVPIKKEDHLQYWLTACYSNYLFDDTFSQHNWESNTDEKKSIISLDGILYHSVKGIKMNPPMQGYNVALRTEIIDNKKIKLVKAGIFETRMINEKEFNLDVLIKHNIHIEGSSWYYVGAEEEKIK